MDWIPKREMIVRARAARCVACCRKRDNFTEARTMSGLAITDRAPAIEEMPVSPDRNESPDVALLLPTLLGGTSAQYPVRQSTFVLSFLAHALAVIVLATSGAYMIHHRQQIAERVVGLMADIAPYELSPAAKAAGGGGGGGGGGDRDKLPASKGALPRLAREQFAPPAVVLRNNDPKLPMEPTVVVPFALPFPQTGAVGDPLSNLLGPPSNGPGSGGGIGSGSGGGVGSGTGPGVGPGHGGGYGGGAYRVGGGITAPRAIYAPDPEFSEEARKAKYQGTVILWVVVGPDGRVHEVRVQRSLGMGLDERAAQTIRTWRFDPARRNGVPVAVQVNVEVNFRLY
jgi:TonB family protein